MKIKAYELKGLVEKKAYSSYLVYGQNKGLVSEKSRIIIDSFTDNETEIINKVLKKHLFIKAELQDLSIGGFNFYLVFVI